MNQKKVKLLVFSAPSGSGKTTIVRDVLKKNPDYVFSISVTTRKKRNNEIDGKDYFFVSEEDFENRIKNDEFVEWEKFYDYYYGTLKSQIELNISKNLCTVFEVDVKGALSIKKHYPESVLIFIAPPSIDVLKERLAGRKTETLEDYKKRIERAEMELSYQKSFDYVVVNDNLELAKEEVNRIIMNEIKEQ